jgi:hypothetical protein
MEHHPHMLIGNHAFHGFFVLLDSKKPGGLAVPGSLLI